MPRHTDRPCTRWLGAALAAFLSLGAPQSLLAQPSPADRVLEVTDEEIEYYVPQFWHENRALQLKYVTDAVERDGGAEQMAREHAAGKYGTLISWDYVLEPLTDTTLSGKTRFKFRVWLTLQYGPRERTIKPEEDPLSQDFQAVREAAFEDLLSEVIAVQDGLKKLLTGLLHSRGAYRRAGLAAAYESVGTHIESLRNSINKVEEAKAQLERLQGRGITGMKNAFDELAWDLQGMNIAMGSRGGGSIYSTSTMPDEDSAAITRMLDDMHRLQNRVRAGGQLAGTYGMREGLGAWSSDPNDPWATERMRNVVQSNRDRHEEVSATAKIAPWERAENPNALTRDPLKAVNPVRAPWEAAEDKDAPKGPQTRNPEFVSTSEDVIAPPKAEPPTFAAMPKPDRLQDPTDKANETQIILGSASNPVPMSDAYIRDFRREIDRITREEGKFYVTVYEATTGSSPQYKACLANREKERKRVYADLEAKCPRELFATYREATINGFVRRVTPQTLATTMRQVGQELRADCRFFFRDPRYQTKWDKVLNGVPDLNPHVPHRDIKGLRQAYEDAVSAEYRRRWAATRSQPRFQCDALKVQDNRLRARAVEVSGGGRSAAQVRQAIERYLASRGMRDVTVYVSSSAGLPPTSGGQRWVQGPTISLRGGPVEAWPPARLRAVTDQLSALGH